MLPKTLDERLILVCIVLGLLLAAAGAKIVRLQEALDAKPAVTEHRAVKEERGPVTTTRRYAPPPAPTMACPRPEPVLLEEVVTAGPVKREETFAHSEVPSHVLAPKKRTRYLGVGVDPLNYARLPRIRAGVTLWNKVDAGVSYDARFSPIAGAVGLELAYRF